MKTLVKQSSKNFKSILAIFSSKRMLINFLLGIYSGLPLLLTGSTLQAWMTERGISLATIGAMGLVGLPYSLKFLWAPLFDSCQIGNFDRRKSWLIIVQLGLVFFLALLGLISWEERTFLLVLLCLGVTFFSASQDVIIDAYRRESLEEDEIGLGSSLSVMGYRMGMLVSGAGALGLSQIFSWTEVYVGMAFVVATGMIVTLLADAPRLEHSPPRSIKEAIIGPFSDYLKKEGALTLLLFLLLYKVGDNIAGQMTMPFYLQMGFEKLQIVAVVKLYGLWSLIAGGIIGGLILVKIGLFRSLVIFGVLQGVSTLGFAFLSWFPQDLTVLTGAITFENLTAGMGSSAQIALMANLTNKKFSATQFALLSAIIGIPRVLLSAPAGVLASFFGWNLFFIFCAIIALPGMLILIRIKKFIS